MSILTGYQVLLTTAAHFASGKRVFSGFSTEMNGWKRDS